jgi:hypothetical protein
MIRKLTILLLLLLLVLSGCNTKEQEDFIFHLNLAYGDITSYTTNDGQWLNIYQAISDSPTPVYIWAHGNGHTYKDAHQKYRPFIDALLEEGISVISWESYREMTEDNYLDIMADALLMFDWVQEHATEYNLDLNNIIIGGHSRGTIASWELAHSGYSGIKGIYYGDAAGNLYTVEDTYQYISNDSPPILLSYTASKVNNDGVHDPNSGQLIIDIYIDNGFASNQARLLENQGYPSMSELGFYSKLVEFCLDVIAIE